MLIPDFKKQTEANRLAIEDKEREVDFILGDKTAIEVIG
jgi:hypothetical protein